MKEKCQEGHGASVLVCVWNGSLYLILLNSLCVTSPRLLALGYLCV